MTLHVSGVLWWGLLSGCATEPVASVAPSSKTIPTLQGSYHEVHPGDTLWRISHAYGLDARVLASANRIPLTEGLKTGQRLFIPLPTESSRFFWPVRGALGATSASRGIEIAAPPGSLVRASRSGLVAVATRRLAGWGKTIVIDHFDGYLTIYSGLEQILVAPGTHLRQGTPVGTLGAGALHFEIRYGARPRSAIALLPSQ